jgi:hypothetical protein
VILQALINNRIFSYLNLIKSSKSNYEVRIIIVIIAALKMFMMSCQITCEFIIKIADNVIEPMASKDLGSCKSCHDIVEYACPLSQPLQAAGYYV